MKPFIYKPHWSHDPALDKSHCLASVPDGGRSVGHHQCSRRPWKDGWCKQHHPDSVANRREESNRRYEKKRKTSLPYRYGELLEKLDALRAENERLRNALGVYANPDNWRVETCCYGDYDTETFDTFGEHDFSKKPYTIACDALETKCSP